MISTGIDQMTTRVPVELNNLGLYLFFCQLLFFKWPFKCKMAGLAAFSLGITRPNYLATIEDCHHIFCHKCIWCICYFSWFLLSYFSVSSPVFHSIVLAVKSNLQPHIFSKWGLLGITTCESELV